MNRLLRRLLLTGAVALPLLLGPLSAQETAPEPAKSPASETAPAEEPIAPPADAGESESDTAEENVSADNSLSFPVDI